MARSLEESRDELESQNTELEMQAIELEERQVELTEASDELRAQRDELEATAAQLADEKRARRAATATFADRLAASSATCASLAALALDDAGRRGRRRRRRAVRARAGATTRAGRAQPCSGWSPAPLAEYAMAGGEGAGARAVAARDVVHRRRGRPALRVQTLAGEAAVRWELHVPLQPRRARRGRGDAGRRQPSGVRRDEARDPAAAGRRRRRSRWPRRRALAQRNWLSQVNAAVLDCVREGIALFGLDHELVFANAAMERLADAAVDADRRRRSARAARPETAAVDREAYFAEWEAILADADEPTADELEVAGMVLERYTAPVDDASGARIGRLVVLRDVTREREAERLKSDLMSTVSHELRTPLASVLGYAELLRTRAAGRRRRATRSSGPSTARPSACRR